MNQHTHYELQRFAVLASSGELAPSEIEQLSSHLETCPNCRQLVQDARRISAEVPFAPGAMRYLESVGPRGADKDLPEDHLVHLQSEAKTQVIQRLRAAGALGDLQTERKFPKVARPRPLRHWQLLVWAATASCLIATICFGVWSTHRAVARARAAEAKLTALNSQIAEASKSNRSLEATQATLRSQMESQRQHSAQQNSTFAELESAHHADLSRLNELNEKLRIMSTDLDEAHKQLAASDAQKQNLAAQLRIAEQSSAAEREGQLNKSSVLEAQIRSLTRRAEEQKAAIERQTKLLATDRKIRDLMGARNLHIIDVSDVNPDGQAARWFGRVFYTEGRSLIFYAYELDALTARPAVFQAWGQRQDRETKVKVKPRSLGVFYADQNDKSLWVLRFEDPQVLAEIDAVFLTVEALGGSNVPHGKPILYSNLLAPANHP